MHATIGNFTSYVLKAVYQFLPFVILEFSIVSMRGNEQDFDLRLRFGFAIRKEHPKHLSSDCFYCS